jgi:NDP-4-keto-2,6-dideoxyhexose 3-C-methyltransferase
MYHNNYGFKSGMSDSVIIDLDDIVTHAFQYVNDPRTWLDIASNDGTLLSFVPNSVYKVGVDPVEILCIEAEEHANLIINDYFHGDIASTLTGHGFDVITSISCFYDMPDPNQFVQDVKYALSPTGVWVIQQNYLLTTLELGAIDNFCHEHLEYYTLYSLEKLLNKFGLEVNEVSTSMVNGGVIRTVVSHKGTFPIDESVYGQRSIEADYGIDTMQPYKDFTLNMVDNLNKLRNLILDLKDDKHSIAILAASTRGATIWQTIGLGPDQIDYAIEKNPAKVGKWFSAVGVPIISEHEADKRMPDYAIIGPWFYGQDIASRMRDYIDSGGCLITPLPDVKIIDKNNIVNYINGKT